MEEKQTQWQEFINRLESGLSDIKQNVDNTINDSSATEEQKRNASRDYAKQSLFLQQVQGMYDNGDYNNPTNTFGVNGTGAIYLSYKDSKYHSLTMAPWVYNGGITEGDTITAQVMTSDEISLVSTLEDIWSGTKTVTGEERQNVDDVTLYIGCTFGVGPRGTGFHATLVDSGNYFTGVDLAEYIRGPQGVFAGVYIVNYTGAPQGVLTQNTFSGTSQSVGYWSSGNQINVGYATIIEIEPEEKENPWDYYNDNILPTITDPDKQAIPGGYEPTEPVGPSGDPDDGPEDDEAPDKTDWGDPMKPDNGFGIPYAFANYIAFNEAGLRNFAEKLWDAPDDFWEALSITNKNSANWLDYFISLRAYPYWVNSTGEIANIYVGAGGKFYLGDAGTDVYAAAAQHITFFTLHFEVPKYYNNFLDFAPYTKAQIYLPFSGTWEVNPKFLYHSRICISLKLDITDGSGVWQVYRFPTVEESGSGPSYIILEKQCKIGVEIPLSGLNATTMSSNIVNATLGNYQRAGSAMSKIAGGLVGGGAGALVGGPIGAVVGMAAGAAISGLEGSVDIANANREIPVVSGGMAGLAAANCNVIPSITLIRPVVENPESFPHTVGHLVNKASKLEKLSGFTTCRNVDVSNVGQATDKEKAQLKQILEDGFYA